MLADCDVSHRPVVPPDVLELESLLHTFQIKDVWLTHNGIVGLPPWDSQLT